MVNDGTLHYDHDRDGTHSQIDGCTVSANQPKINCSCGYIDTLLCIYIYLVWQVKFRNPNHETFFAVSYINRVLTVSSLSPLPLSLSLSLSLSPSPPSICPLQVMTNINGGQDWLTCFKVSEVDLPTGYYFGFSAATGDLAG